MKRHFTLTLALVLALVAPLLTTPTATASGPLPRITITDTGLFRSDTGAPFTPRGANYIRLADNERGDHASYIETFEPGPDGYDRARAITTAQHFERYGYKVVRTFVDEGRPLDWTTGRVHGMGRGLDDEQPVNEAYLDNVADFIRIMADHGVYTIPVTYRLPQNCFYYRIVRGDGTCSTTATQPLFEARNTFFLDGGFIRAKAEYLKRFSAAMLARLGPYATAILAYQSENEAYYDTSKGPWSMDSGTVLSNATGYTYDMAVPAARQQLADASFVKYTIAAKNGLLDGDPNGKLAIGVYTPNAVGKAGIDGMAVHCSAACTPGVDYRYPVRALVGTLYGKLDLVDIHFYPKHPSTGYTVGADLRSAEVDQYRKPWLVGEIGAHKAWWGNDINTAAQGLRYAQVAACAVGTGAQGSLVWTFDTDRDTDSAGNTFPDQTALFHLTTGTGAINATLAPSSNPLMCTNTKRRVFRP
jgi:hypothetical protein